MSTPGPFLPIAAPSIGALEREYVNDAVASGWVSSIGPYLERFEREFADFCGARHAIAVSNGTVAIHLALHTLGVGPGDEVIVPALTFVATAHAVLQTGATPVFVDVDPKTACLDPEAVRHAIGPRCKAIVPVHLFGHPADMDALGAIARERGIELVEDAAEAHGARVGSKRVGSIGRVGTFSFYGNKVLTTGEGGALVTDDDALAERLRFLKDHGMSKERRYFHSELAFNYRMTNLQAALGCAQMQRVAAFIEKKRAIFGWYRDALKDEARLELLGEREGYGSVFWMTSVVLASGDEAAREAVRDRMRAVGVDSRPFFVPMQELPHLRSFRALDSHGQLGCPVASRMGARGLSLPSGCDLERTDVERAAQALRDALSG